MNYQENELKEVKELILEQSAKIFAENDYVRVRMLDIAEAAGVSRGPLYYYFKNKEELFTATVLYLIEEQKINFDKILSKKAPIRDILRDEYLQCFSYNNSLLQTMKNQQELNEIKEYHEFSYWLYNKKKVVFTQAKERGELKENSNPNQLATFLYIFYTGVIQMNESRQTGFDVFDSELLDNSVDTYLKIVDALFLI